MSRITLRIMRQEDISMGMRLKTLAGWNQTQQDWAYLIREGNSNWVATCDGKAIGTVTTLPYQHISWIGMVLVDPKYRRQGVGTRLIQQAIKHCATPFVGLDATLAGRALYQTMGFVQTNAWKRWLRSPQVVYGMDYQMGYLINENHWKHINTYDSTSFGYNREHLLRYLFENSPELAFYAKNEGRIVGYSMGRKGSQYIHIGPILADDVSIASQLVNRAVSIYGDRQIVIDAPDSDPLWMQYLDQMGFGPQRTLYRMYYPTAPPMSLFAPFAHTGPEFG